MSANVDVLAVLTRHLALAKEVASEAQIAEAREVLASVDELAAASRLIANGAMPATASGHTCFVPRYEIDLLRAALARITGGQP